MELDGGRACELCNQEAFLHCASDSAFLCLDCDARVHQANFLVARHVRQALCSHCKRLTEKFISGYRSSLSQPICASCSNENPLDAVAIPSSSSSSSDCISSTESSAVTAVKKTIPSSFKKKVGKRVNASSSSESDVSGEISEKRPRFSGREKVVDSKAEGVFVIWCKRLGLNNGNLVVPLACRALELCLERSTALPFRVCSAASFWAGLKMSEDISVPTWQNLERLEAVSGVPAKLIVAVETRLARVMKMRRRSRQDLEEGWAECNARVARAGS